MKKIFGLVALSLLTFAYSEAKVMRVNNTPNVDAGYTSLENALLDAASGDTIYLESSSQAYGSRDAYSFDDLKILKPVTIVGPGYFLAENRITNFASGEAFIGGEVKILAEDVVISGVILSKVSVEANNALINKCQILAGNSNAVEVSSEVNGCAIQQNFIVGDIKGSGYPHNVFVSNNIICGYISNFERCRIEHNTFGKYSRYGNVKNLRFCTVVENVFYEKGKSQTNTSAFINNYFGDYTQYMSGTEFSLDSNYNFKEDSPLAIQASDGGAVGAYGGVSPYVCSGVPVSPVVKNISGPTSVNALQGMPLVISYNLDASLNKEDIIITEYYYDKDPGFGKALLGGTSNSGKVSFSADLSGLKPGFHTLNVRGRNSEGWSHTVSYPFVMFEKVSEIIGTEYFYNEDPGEGKGLFVKAVVLDSMKNITRLFNPSVDNIEPGYHSLSVRALDNTNKWSDVVTKPFVYVKLINPVKKAEYYFDEDPGFGNGLSVNLAQDGTRLSYLVDLSYIEKGKHVMYLRTLDEDGRWSVEESSSFTVDDKGNVKWLLPVTISPNPARFSFTVSFDEKISNADSVMAVVSISAQSGKEISSASYRIENNVVTISAADYSTGNYLVSIQKGEAVVTKRLIVKK